MENFANASLVVEEHGRVNGDTSVSTLSDLRDIPQAKHFSTTERLLLLKLLLEHVEILSSKETTLLHVKRAVWQHISANYHVRDGVECRTLRQLQKFWENYKARRKRAIERGRTLRQLLQEDINDLQDCAENETAILGQLVKQENIEDSVESADMQNNGQLDQTGESDSYELEDPTPEPDVSLGQPPEPYTPSQEHYPSANHGPPALLRFSDVQIIPVSQQKRKISEVKIKPSPEKKPRIEAAEAYYELKIQHEIEKHQMEKQILRQKLENLMRKHEKELQTLNVEVAFKEEVHNAKMAILKEKLERAVS